MAKLIFFLLIIIIVEIYTTLSFKHKLISLLSESDPSYNPKRFNITNSLVLYNLYDQFQDYFYIKSNTDSDAGICWESIFSNLIADYDYSILYFNSGHKLTQIGDSMSCVEGNNIYLLTLLTYELNETSFKIEDKISFFTSKNRYNLGICIWKECINFINKTLINNVDKDLKYNLDKIYHIKDIKAIWNYEELKKQKKEKSFGIKIIGLILMIYGIIFILLKIIVYINKRKKKKNSLEAYQKRLERKKRVDYLKMEETNVIKEEENEDDIIDEDEEEDHKVKRISTKSRSNSVKPIEKFDEIKNKSDEEEMEENEENEEGEEEEDENDNDDSKISNDSLFKKEIEQTKIRYIENNLNIMEGGGNLGDYDLEEKLAKKIHLLKDGESNKNKKNSCMNKINNFNNSFLTLIRIKTLTEFKNNIYSNKGLEMITGIRTFVLIIITLNINFTLFEESPAIMQMNDQFINNILFCWVKFSSFGIYLWIYLDGFVYTFKLMHYVKEDKSFKTFFKFMINLIPKILLFLIIFYGVYFFQKDIGKLTVSNSMLYEQYIENDYNYKCFNNVLYLFFPFISSNNSDNTINSNNNYNNCYQFTYLLINEFYCIIILILMFYFLYKYKSRLLDKIISVFIIINILLMNFLPYFFEKLAEQKYYLLKYVLGENFSIRYPHTMFNIFFIGVLSGLIYYYYYYSVNDLNSYLIEKDRYLPLNYLTNVMQFLFKCNWIIKSIVILLFIGLIIADCLIYYILMKSNGTEDEVLYGFSLLLKIIYLYEMPIVIFAFSILIIFILLLEDKFHIKEFLGGQMFYIMEKISFSYVCLIQMMSLLFISSSNNNDETWSFVFLFYITCFEFAICSLTSFIFTLVFELPIKVLANIMRGKDLKNKNKLIK